MLALLQPQCSPPGQARRLAVPRHPWAWPSPRVPCPALALTLQPQPALSLLCLPVPDWTLRACLLGCSLPLPSVSQSQLVSCGPQPIPSYLGSCNLPCPLLFSVPTSCLLGLSQPHCQGSAPWSSLCSCPELARPLHLVPGSGSGSWDPELTLWRLKGPHGSLGWGRVGLVPELPTPMRRCQRCDFQLRV